MHWENFHFLFKDYPQQSVDPYLTPCLWILSEVIKLNIVYFELKKYIYLQ